MRYCGSPSRTCNPEANCTDIAPGRIHSAYTSRSCHVRPDFAVWRLVLEMKTTAQPVPPVRILAMQLESWPRTAAPVYPHSLHSTLCAYALGETFLAPAMSLP